MGLYLGKHPHKINMRNGKHTVRYYKPSPVTYLTFSSPETLSITAPGGWDGTLYYSTDTKNWTEWDGTEISGTTLYMRGSGNTTIIGIDNYMWGNIWTLSGSDISCIGNIENLLDYETVKQGKHPTLADYCYSGMFYGCTGLTQAPELPATTLPYSCYSNMFYGCTGLTQAPELPATTLADYCYDHMFSGCTGLTQAPELPATTLADYCYYNMFYGCKQIKLSKTRTGEYTQAYRIPTTGTGVTASYALNNMFYNTGGTFTGTPTINTTYYLHSSNTIV